MSGHINKLQFMWAVKFYAPTSEKVTSMRWWKHSKISDLEVLSKCYPFISSYSVSTVCCFTVDEDLCWAVCHCKVC